MKYVTNKELKGIKGGEFTVWTGLGIAAVLVFLAGLIDGFVHPKGCGGDIE